MKAVREVFGVDAANKLLQQGWVLLGVHSNHSGGREDGFSYLLGSAVTLDGSDVKTLHRSIQRELLGVLLTEL